MVDVKEAGEGVGFSVVMNVAFWKGVIDLLG